MMDPTKAVFLSYAREDAEPARRIAEALRASGVEVWFDANELRGGDVWDAHIRSQIRECALFVPIISAQTQARAEGYFRREWKLADERTADMGRRRAFLVPICIDGTKDADADVPDSFLKVQWTRLPGALPTPQFVAQVQRLLEQGAGGKEPGTTPATQSAGPAQKSLTPAVLLGATGVIAVAVAAGLFLLRPPEPTPAAPAPGTSSLLPASPEPAERAPSRPPPADAKSIAVLPFTNMSEEKVASAFFADGVHEDILTNLSFIKELRVTSRTSVEQFRGTTKPIREIAKELGVAYILEGSVRRAGGKVRVTGQLIRVATDEHVWAQSFDRDISDIFAVQSELAQAIARSLQAAIEPETKALLDRRPTQNTAAYDAYLRARELNNSGGLGDPEEEIRLLNQAVRLDPGFAAAWAAQGSRHAFAHFNRDRSAERLAQATRAIETAVRLAPDDPLVIEAVGDYRYYAFRDYPGATEQYLKLARLRPNDVTVFRSLAFIYRRQGRIRECVANLEQAFALDPDMGNTALELTNTLIAARRYHQAIEVGRKFLQRHPGHITVTQALGFAELAVYGQSDALRRLRGDFPVPSEKQAELNYIRLQVARVTADWAEAIRINQGQRYYAGDTDSPPIMQDVWAAAVLGEAGDLAGARRQAAEALPALRAELVRQPESGPLWAGLAVGAAIAGDRTAALAAIEKARAAMPESIDAVQGPLVSAYCASALAWAGEKEQALAEFQRLLHVPFSVNPVLERGMYAGSWQPLRDDPRFQALLSDPKNNAPVF